MSDRCYEVSYDLVAKATKQAGGRPLPTYRTSLMFCAIWGSHIDLARWREIPDVLRGRGAPGAMVGDGRAVNMMEADLIWAGKLKPGAVIQVWRHFGEYIRVLNGNKPSVNSGHSFIFRHYTHHRDGAISGMKVTDNGYHGDNTVPRGAWGYWVGANLGTSPLRLPDPWWTPEERERIKALHHQSG